PGRTASVMTLFALVAMAAYARYERIGAKQIDATLSPLDPPATKGTQALGKVSRLHFFWPVFAIIAGALAFGSYEQSVMLPATLFGVAMCMRLQRYRVRWAWQVPFWGLLIAYFAVRHAVLPSD